MTAPLLLMLLAQSPNPYLAQAKVLHQGLEFEKCLKRLEQATRWDNSKSQLAEIELYAGLCAFGLGQEAEAGERFEMGLKLDSKLALPPLVGPKVTALFQKKQAKVVPAVEAAAPVEPKPAPAPPPPLAAPAPPPARVPVAVLEAPTKKSVHLVVPLVVAGAGVLSGGFATFFGLATKSLEQRANTAEYESDALALGDQARNRAQLTNILWVVAGVVLVAAVIAFFVAN